MRGLALVAIAWVPIAIGAAVRAATGRPPDEIVVDPSVHVRLLVSLPVLVLAHHALDVRTSGALGGIRNEHAYAGAAIDAIGARMARLRSAYVVEVLLALVALAGGQAVLWGVTAPSGFFSGIEYEPATTFAKFWYTAIALPLLQFLVLRFLWRWATWCYALVQLWRLDLSLDSLHPDRGAGLRLLGVPIDAYAIFIASNCITASAAWITQIELLGIPINAYVPRFVAFVVVAMLAACGPLLLFSPQIYRARHRDMRRFHALAREYVDGFRRKWFADHPAPELLGTQDLQSLHDLCGAYEVADSTRALAFGTRAVLVLWVGAVLPLLPIAFTTMSVSDVAKYLGKMMQLPMM